MTTLIAGLPTSLDGDVSDPDGDVSALDSDFDTLMESDVMWQQLERVDERIDLDLLDATTVGPRTCLHLAVR